MKGTDVLSFPSRPRGGIELEVVGGPDEGRRWVLAEGRSTVGKDDDCTIQLSDRSVSGRHVELEVTSLGLHLIDLESTNGTFFLGSRVKEATVPVGARLTLGRTVLLVSLASGGSSVATRYTYGSLVGHSPAMQELYSTLERIEPLEVPVLIVGETGVGKELIAREIHAHSRRARQPFEVLDCAGVTPALIESELFGHHKGAFTGATHAHVGVFARASGGTLFIDEVGELPLQVQPRLLRVLESRTVQPLGSTRRVEVDFRLIAATHRDLKAMVARGEFREDLYFRLNVVALPIPPLRERREDIAPLVQSLLERSKLDSFTLSAETLALFTGYDWPGNVRELKNAILRVVALGAPPRDMAGSGDGARRSISSVDLEVPLPVAKGKLIDAFEREYLVRQLERTDASIRKAARLSGVDRTQFKRLLRRHGLMPEHDDDLET